jgi:predicted AAA+ superfamily ATPase
MDYIMKDLIQQLIIDGQSVVDAENTIPRDGEYTWFEGKVTTLIGPRRCGKSVLLKQIQKKLITSLDINLSRCVFINFMDERLFPLTTQLLTLIEETYFESYPANHQEKIYWFFDEIQLIDKWSLFIERLRRDKTNQVFISGSSAQLLSREIATELRGRTVTYELMPFSYHEIYSSLKMNVHRLNSKDKGRAQNISNRVLKEGSYPECINLPWKQSSKILSEYYRSILSRDVIERHKPRDPHVVEATLKTFIYQMSSPCSLTKMSARLKSLGFSISVAQLSEYLQWFQDAFALFPVSIFSDSINKRNANPKKIYVVDNGIYSAVSNKLSDNKSLLLENRVYLELRNKYGDNIYYYKTTSGFEVDFIVNPEDPILYQVCVDLNDPETQERELRSLHEAQQELKVKKAYVITQFSNS